MASLNCASVCVSAVAACLCLALAPASSRAEGRPQTAKPAAANPYRVIKRNAPSTTTVIARWTEPPTFAIAPRTIGITLDSNYFTRSAYAGPAKRGHAYHVHRKPS